MYTHETVYEQKITLRFYNKEARKNLTEHFPPPSEDAYLNIIRIQTALQEF